MKLLATLIALGQQGLVQPFHARAELGRGQLPPGCHRPGFAAQFNRAGHSAQATQGPFLDSQCDQAVGHDDEKHRPQAAGSRERERDIFNE